MVHPHPPTDPHTAKGRDQHGMLYLYIYICGIWYMVYGRYMVLPVPVPDYLCLYVVVWFKIIPPSLSFDGMREHKREGGGREYKIE